MTPEDVAARLAALRVAGAELRRRPARSVIDALASVLERWRDPLGPERRALEDRLPGVTGFSAETVRQGLARALAPWSGDALRALAERELGRSGDFAAGYEATAVLLAGSIPMPTLLAVIAPLALRSPVLVKTAARDPLTAPLAARSIAAIDPALSACVEVVSFPGSDGPCTDAFLAADCVVATGSDATIDAVAARVGPEQRLLRHGHRLSVALLGPEATEGRALEEAARGIALDASLWDQLGCLSPVAVYVAADTPSCQRVFASLADALAEIGGRLPRGAVDPAAAALAAHERSGVELRAAAGRPVALRAAPDASWTVVCEEDASPRPAPLHRFLRVHPSGSVEALFAALAPIARHLAGASRAGFGDDTSRVEDRLRALGATWICAPGELQCPPLSWPRDGLAPLGSLVRA